MHTPLHDLLTLAEAAVWIAIFLTTGAVLGWHIHRYALFRRARKMNLPPRRRQIGYLERI